MIKAVYVPNAISNSKGAYFIYYYDIFTHSFYINDLDNLSSETRTSAINIIENIVTKAYHQEMNSFPLVLKKLQMRKTPKVFYIYHQKITNEIVIDKVSLKSVKNISWEIIWFKNPTWDSKSKS